MCIRDSGPLDHRRGVLGEPLVGVVQPATAQDDVDDLAARGAFSGRPALVGGGNSGSISCYSRSVGSESYRRGEEGKAPRSTRSAVLTVWCDVRGAADLRHVLRE